MQAQQFLDIHQQVAAMDGSDATVRAQNAPEGLRVQLGMVIRKLKQHWHLENQFAPEELRMLLGMVIRKLEQHWHLGTYPGILRKKGNQCVPEGLRMLLGMVICKQHWHPAMHFSVFQSLLESINAAD
eukprot:1160884-Pelagomonas_calceolata.AAC.19